MGPTTDLLRALHAVLDRMGEVCLAVSGGVDSMTLAVVAGRRLGARAAVIHATSPAVPPEATARVRRYASLEGWPLEVIDAGEFADERYLANPSNRCFFCKTNLYGALAARTSAMICSGTNTDDLGDYRPGLQAAAAHRVRHPYVEAGIDKAAVRRMARVLGLDDLAELPAAPCLSSRLETGIRVSAARLRLVHRVERLIEDALEPETVRCRVMTDGVTVQLDAESLAAIEGEGGHVLRRQIGDLLVAHGEVRAPRYAPYRMGSAFHRPATHG
ncbi:MAG TPA: hypothetical protein VFZ01_06575 [Geminicoccaceae bacterium]